MAKLSKILFPLDPLLSPSLYIHVIPGSVSTRMHQPFRSAYLSVLEDSYRGNMIVHIVIYKKGRAIFHLVTVSCQNPRQLSGCFNVYLSRNHFVHEHYAFCSLPSKLGAISRVYLLPASLPGSLVS